MRKEAPRRNPLEKPPDEEQSALWQTVLSQIADPERVEEAKNPKPRKRKREWEKSHKPKHYRGVPPEVRQRVREVAESLNVPADEVARAFVEYSLSCIERGSLNLIGLPIRRRSRMTLYPITGSGWGENTWSPQPPKPSGRRKPNPLWNEIAHYRIPDELHKQIKDLAGVAYAVGEVMAALLKHGIESYQNGVLVLLPQPKIGPHLDWSGGAK